MPDAELTYCVVNTSQRELLLRGLDAIARERAALPFATEVLVLDNGSRDGSAEAARAHPAVDEVIVLGERRGKALNDSELMARAQGRYALLLNEDSELLWGDARAVAGAAGAHGCRVRGGAAAAAGWRSAGTRLTTAAPPTPAASPGAAAPGPAAPAGSPVPQPCAWRFPTVATALAGAVFAHRAYTVQSKGARTREVDWCQSSALLVRREAAAQVGYMDPDFFVYSDEVDFARRLRDAGWRSLYVPGARALPSRATRDGRRTGAPDR